MKTWKIILLIALAVVAGFTIGYLVSGGAKPSEEMHAAHKVSGDTESQVWTCAMHPQIRQNEPGDCPICGMDLIPLSEMSSDNPLVMEMTHEAAKLANISTVRVGINGGSALKTISLTGKIQVDERQISSQVAHIPGRIEQLFVTFTGEQVNKGQKMVTLYSPELVGAQRELIEAARWKDTRPQLLEAARNKLRYWKISESTIEQIEESGKIEPNITVYADQGGVVLNRRVAIGDHVMEGQVLFDIVNLNRVWALFDAYEEDLATVRLDDEISFTVQAVPGQTFKARISFIDPVINPKTRVALLRAEVSNTRGLLKPEMLVRGVIESHVRSKAQLMTVPKSAVLWTGARSVVYVELPGTTVPSFEFREVTIGEAVGEQYTVLSGLEDGERVVVNGAFVIDASAQLNNMASMMNRNVRVTGMSETGPDYSQNTPERFKDQLMDLMHQYIPLKDALVNSDDAAAREEATTLLSKLTDVDMTLVMDDAHHFWMEQQEAINAHASKIVESEDLEEQRTQFSFLTQALVGVIGAFGSRDTLYLQHCPMAFDNSGADWLSDASTILNPYFGDKMLKCGKVTATFTAQGPAPKPAAKHNH
jgi:Cu(I)/Ag(I) efflux system membrane fusion protein